MTVVDRLTEREYCMDTSIVEEIERLRHLRFNGAAFTQGWGINNSGQIVGAYVDAVATNGFVDTSGIQWFKGKPVEFQSLKNTGCECGSAGSAQEGTATIRARR